MEWGGGLVPQCRAVGVEAGASDVVRDEEPEDSGKRQVGDLLFARISGHALQSPEG